MDVIRESETTPVPVQLDLELAMQVESFMLRMMQSFSKKVGETVSLMCAHAITVAVLDSLSGSALAWFLNGFPMEMDPSRILYNKGNIDITDLTPGDSGVYTCLVEWGPENARDNVTVGVYSLVVTADSPTRYVFEKDGMRLVCNSLPLGFLFPAATRQWFYNSTNVTIPMVTLASNASEEVVPRVSKSMDGVWECRVTDWDTQRVWTTAWFRLGVQGEPSAIAKAYRVMSDHVYVVIVVATIILVLLCIGFIYSVKMLKNQETETDDEFHNTRNGWEEKFNQFGSGGKVKVNDSDLPPKKMDDEEGGGEGTQKKERGEGEGDFDDMEDKGEKASSKVNLLDEGEHEEEEGMREADKDNKGEVEEDKKDTAGDGGDDGGDDGGGEESDTNKSANLSKRARRRSKRKVRWESKDNRRNAVLIGNNENISNIERRATHEDAMAMKLGEKTEHRRRGDGKRKKRKQRIVYPEVSKESALKWLVQNSPQLKRFKSILSDRGNTSAAARTRSVEPVRPMRVGWEAYHEGINRGSAFTRREVPEQLWRMPEFRPPDIRTWLTHGRERLAGWTTKPSSWGHSDIRYSVLPQADEDDFMDF